MFNTPALNEFKVDWVRRTMSELARRIFTKAFGTKIELPQFIGAKMISELPNSSTQMSEVPKFSSRKLAYLCLLCHAQILTHHLQMLMASLQAQRRYDRPPNHYTILEMISLKI
jgi:hypothetical protein